MVVGSGWVLSLAAVFGLMWVGVVRRFCVCVVIWFCMGWLSGMLIACLFCWRS